jgi:hypothetical protein
MERLSRLICEVLSSTYVKKIKHLISQIDWNNIDRDFLDIYKSSNILIGDIENIGNYDGDNAYNHLNELKSQAKDIIYVLRQVAEYYNQK